MGWGAALESPVRNFMQRELIVTQPRVGFIPVLLALGICIGIRPTAAFANEAVQTNISLEEGEEVPPGMTYAQYMGSTRVLPNCNAAIEQVWYSVAELSGLVPGLGQGIDAVRKVATSLAKIGNHSLCGSDAVTYAEMMRAIDAAIDEAFIALMAEKSRVLIKQLQDRTYMLQHVDELTDEERKSLAKDLNYISNEAEGAETFAVGRPVVAALAPLAVLGTLKVVTNGLAMQLEGEESKEWHTYYSAWERAPQDSRNLVEPLEKELKRFAYPQLERRTTAVAGNHPSASGFRFVYARVFYPATEDSPQQTIYEKSWSCDSAVNCGDDYLSYEDQYYPVAVNRLRKARRDTRNTTPPEYLAFRHLIHLEPRHPFRLKNRTTGKCIKSEGGSSSGSLVLGNCSAADVNWHFMIDSGQIESKDYPGYCIEAAGESTYLAPCEQLEPTIDEINSGEGPLSPQRWALHTVGGYLIHLDSERCLGVQGGRNNDPPNANLNGTPIVTEPCNYGLKSRTYYGTPRVESDSPFTYYHYDYGRYPSDVVTDQEWSFPR